MAEVQKKSLDDPKKEQLLKIDFREILESQSDKAVEKNFRLEQIIQLQRSIDFPILFGVKTPDGRHAIMMENAEGTELSEIGSIVFSAPVREGYPTEIQHVQLINQDGRTFTLPESLASVRNFIDRTQVSNYTLAGHSFIQGTKVLQDTVTTPSRNARFHPAWFVEMLHEYAHAFSDIPLEKTLTSRTHLEQSLNSAKSSVPTIQDLMKPISSKPILTEEDAQIILEEELEASNYALNRIFEILTFLKVDSTEFKTAVITYLALALATYKVSIRKALS